jgi:hypothetical protein
LLGLLAAAALPSAAATFTVTNTLASGPGSLSYAIASNNATAGTNTIAFNILPLDGTVKTLFNSNGLPFITRPVVIDGYTQDPAHSHTNTLADADNAVLLIELNGNYPFFGGGVVPLNFQAGSSGSLVRGLVINNFSGDAIDSPQDNSVTNIVLEGNFIGTDPTGRFARPNNIGGSGTGAVTLSSPANRIGGTTTGARNIISGNIRMGVNLSADTSGGHNLVQGNFIGVDATGTNALGNGQDGVHIYNAFDVIGGSTRGARNVISGNSGTGVFIGNGTSSARTRPGRSCCATVAGASMSMAHGTV